MGKLRGRSWWGEQDLLGEDPIPPVRKMVRQVNLTIGGFSTIELNEAYAAWLYS